jgi:hypothetical protein
MKVYQIEDTIVAYFDGRLNDSESAELMHRVSISPEIREIFEQHQLIRRMAVRAARNVTVSPNVEDAVFANIAALASQEQKKKLGAFWSMRRGAVVAAVAVLLGVGIVASLKSSEPNSVPYIAPQAQTAITSDVARVHGVADNAPTAETGNISTPIEHRASMPRVAQPTVRDAAPANVQAETAYMPISLVADARTLQAEQIQPPTIISHRIGDLLVRSSDEPTQFEVGLANSTHATMPAAGVGSSSALQDWTFRAGYSFDEENIAGVTFEYGKVNMHTVVPAAPDATYYTGNQVPTWTPMIGAYYEHREAIGRGGFMVAGTVGAGIASNPDYTGNFVTFGLGGRLPIGDHLLAGATVSLTRKHDGGQTKDEILNSGEPVIFDGVDIHNTLITRIEYGLSYRF